MILIHTLCQWCRVSFHSSSMKKLYKNTKKYQISYQYNWHKNTYEILPKIYHKTKLISVVSCVTHFVIKVICHLSCTSDINDTENSIYNNEKTSETIYEIWGNKIVFLISSTLPPIIERLNFFCCCCCIYTIQVMCYEESL